MPVIRSDEVSRITRGSFARYRGYAAIVIGAAAFGLGALTLVGYAVDPDVAGRMAPQTAFAIASLGAGLLLWRQTRRAPRAVSDALIVIAGLVGFVGLVGYAYGADELYEIGPYGPMTLLAAAGLVAAAVGAYAARLRTSALGVLTRDSAGGAVARLLLPAAVLVPLLLGGLRLAGLRAGLVDLATGAALASVLNILAVVAFVIVIAVPLDRADRRRRSAEEDVRSLNASLERRVRERTAELEAANRELEAFVFSVTHDLTMPLRSIAGFVDLLDRRAERLDPEGRRYLGLLRRGTVEMEGLIRALAALSTITRGPLDRRTVDLGSLAQDITSDLRRAHPGRNVTVSIQPGLSAFADPSLARIALVNLLGNAWKFTTPRDPGVIEVGRSEQPRPGFFVRDNGVGFDPGAADRLFAPFQRMHTQEEFPGTGIGLATVRRVLHRHGGDVWAEGAPDRGATFYFTFEPSMADAPQALEPIRPGATGDASV